MTDEQIKQNAEQYAIKICEETPIDYSVVSDAYISGAHSRDEEVERLKKKLLFAQKGLDELAKLYKKGE